MSRPPVEKLGQHTSLISSGSTPLGGSQVYLTNGPVLFIRSQNVLMNQLDLESAVYISDEMDRKIGRTRLQADDVLLNITGASIGRVATFDGQTKRANVNQHVCVIRPDPRVLSARYLSRLIATPAYQRRIQQAQVGGTRQALTFSQIADFEIPLPPMTEQRRIAEVLDRAEALRAKRRAVLAQLDTLTQSIFLDLFGNPRENRSRCKMVPLGELCVKLVDGTHKTPSYTASGVPFITVKNMATGALKFENTKFISEDEYALLTRHVRPERGDILVSKDGTIGVACPVETDRDFSIFVSVALLKIKHDIVDQIFLTGQFRTDWIQSQIRAGTKGIAIRHLHLNDFKKLRVLLPALSLQKEFVRRVVAVEKVKTNHRAWLDKMDAMFAVLQHRAFRGEL
jgi:type I restriction enzyme, S subunit